jgi:hypothetical protein
MLAPSQEPVPQRGQPPGPVEQGVPARGRVAGHPAGGGVQRTSPPPQVQLPSG